MLHIITVATESKYYLPYLQDTVSNFGSELLILGYKEKWGGYVFKLEKSIEFLNSVNPLDIVCFIDGYDVICTRNLDTLVDIFFNIKNRTGCKIVIGKDSGYIPEFISKIYFGTCGNQILNSGTYIGMAGDILEILLEARDMYPNEKDDQMLLTKYCDVFPRKFYLDVHYEIFYSSTKPLTQASIPIQSAPFFVHAPGCGYLDNILTDMGYTVVDPQIQKDLRRYLFKKAAEHGSVFLRKYILWIVVIILLLVIIPKRMKF